ncbi:MAG TPA: hypothetical protein DCK79_08215 [Candidatus Atribacteria bacterium]|jgi:hypothetical protein|nr:hypothetical protein [Candidatus Atribacteria bacterium]
MNLPAAELRGIYYSLKQTNRSQQSCGELNPKRLNSIVGFGKYNPSSIIKNLARIKRKNLLVKIKENSKAVKEQNYFD